MDENVQPRDEMQMEAGSLNTSNVPEGQRCPYCDALLDEGAICCGYCGNDVNGGPMPEQADQAEQAEPEPEQIEQAESEAEPELEQPTSEFEQSEPTSEQPELAPESESEQLGQPVAGQLEPEPELAFEQPESEQLVPEWHTPEQLASELQTPEQLASEQSAFQQPIESAPVPESNAEPAQNPIVSDAPPQKKRIGRKAAIGVAVAVVCCIAFGLGAWESSRAQNYDDANSMLQAGHYAEAVEAFEKLGDYKDSPEKLQEAQNAVDYELASEQLTNGDYEKAAETFKRLGDYKNSPEKLEKANNWIKANAAKEAAGEDPAAWREAAKAFEAVGSEASAEVDECNMVGDYYEAKKLMANKKWGKASELLSDAASASYKDAAELKKECDVHVTYAKAEKLYKDGKYYDAYCTFNSIGDNKYKGTSDASDRAKQCIQSTPENGVVSRSDAYPDDSCELKINNSGLEKEYYKLYMGDDFVISAFINPSDSASFALPAGTYHMKVAYGDEWFGPDDAFGDEGRYFVCTFEGSETVDLEANYAYEISSGAPSEDGKGISNKSTDRESF